MKEEFQKYLHLLQKWNKTYNLTSILDENEVMIKHFEDSLAPLTFWPSVSRVLDLGCGAGFPGIPIKIERPELDLVLCDSNRKKIDFCNALIRELKLLGIKTFHGRGEDPKSLADLGFFDLVFSRATFKIPQFLNIALPYLKTGGIAMIMKGPEWQKEAFLDKTPKILFKSSYLLRNQMGERHILAFQKGDNAYFWQVP